MQNTLDLMLSTGRAVTQDGREIEIHSSIARDSVNKLRELVRAVDAHKTLEVGMACGVSTLAIMEAHQGKHIAIDPNQTLSGPDGWNGVGLEAVKRAGFDDRLMLLKTPSYHALPLLLSGGQKADLIFIDGWHSFDYTFVDLFYSDLLLRDGGILVVDDWAMPQVAFALKFLITHKPYEQLGPRLYDPMNPLEKLKRKFTKNPDGDWGSVRAFRKLETKQTPWHFFESNFYPWFGLYRLWMKLKGLKINNPY